MEVFKRSTTHHEEPRGARVVHFAGCSLLNEGGLINFSTFFKLTLQATQKFIRPRVEKINQDSISFLSFQFQNIVKIFEN